MDCPDKTQIDNNYKRYCAPIFIKNHYPEFYEFLKTNYPDCKKITEAMWLYYNNIDKKPTCKTCGGKVSFQNWFSGYSIYCSRTCMSRGTRDKVRETHINRYGGIGTGSPIIKNKIDNKVNKLYGGSGFKSDIIRNKIENTNLKKYGNINPARTKLIKDKIKTTFEYRYGETCALKVPEFLEKSKQTCNRNHGVDHPGQSPKLIEKAMNTRVEKCGSLAESYKLSFEKSKQTNLKKYGREYGFDYDKIAKTNLDRYGDENPLIARCSRGEIIFRGYSRSSQEFFNKIDAILKNSYTTHYATKDYEYRIDIETHKYYIDYFIEELNIAVEFNGDTWHANPNLFKADDRCFPMDNSITAKDIWEIDDVRIANLSKNGIKTIIIWESDYKKMKDIKDIKNWIVNNITNNI